MTTSPTSSAFSYTPITPKDPSLRPNPHPYAVRTTTSGILTRSNSSGQNSAAHRHHYVPLSPAGKETRKRHRYTKSLTQEPSLEVISPTPLPVPVTFTGNVLGRGQSGWNDSIRSKRLVQNSVFMSAATVEDLPSNPKLWTTSHLSTYLATALRATATSAATDCLATADVKGIIAFTNEANINGRIFLRLIEDDLDKRGINSAWRDALLAASRNLRQNVIKGRIWGDDADTPDSPSPSLPSHPFSSALYNSSSSSLDLTDEDEEGYKQRRRRRGRVHGMVQSFERSGSFSSESSFSQEDLQERIERDHWLKDMGTNKDVAVMSPVEDPVSLIPPSPPLLAAEEPTVETLLVEAEQSGTWGARAWEEFDVAPGVTVKRVDEPPAYDSDIHADTVSRLQNLAAFGSSKAAKSVRLPKGKQDRRVITAIFAPPTSEIPEPSDIGSEEAEAVMHPHPATVGTHLEQILPLRVPDSVASEAIATSREAALEAELAETRALVTAFKARLEEVERKVADLEMGVHHNAVAKEKLLSLTIVENVVEETKPLCNAAKTNAPAGHESDLSASTLLEDDEPLPASKRRSRSLPLQSSTSDTAKSNSSSHKDVDPSSFSEIPPYVLLVGLGVCAVVLRVIFKKAVGRGPGFGWR